jgi:hypothetical protein
VTLASDVLKQRIVSRWSWGSRVLAGVAWACLCKRLDERPRSGSRNRDESADLLERVGMPEETNGSAARTPACQSSHDGGSMAEERVAFTGSMDMARSPWQRHAIVKWHARRVPLSALLLATAAGEWHAWPLECLTGGAAAWLLRQAVFRCKRHS